MNKQKFKKILKNYIETKSINLEELNYFIVDYCKLMNHKAPNTQELSAIIQLIQLNIFDIGYALDNAARQLKLQKINIFDQFGTIIRTELKDL